LRAWAALYNYVTGNADELGMRDQASFVPGSGKITIQVEGTRLLVVSLTVCHPIDGDR